MSVHSEIRERRRKREAYWEAVRQLRPLSWAWRVYLIGMLLFLGMNYPYRGWISGFRWEDDSTRNLSIAFIVLFVVTIGTWIMRERAWRRLVEEIAPQTMQEIRRRRPLLRSRMRLEKEAFLTEAEKKTAEPGATDNPDDAQRLREDH